MAFPTYIAKGTFTTNTSNPSADPPLPAGIQNGDLIIAVISYPVTNTPTSADPAWTLLAETSTGTTGTAGCIGVAVFYAIYAGSALGGFSTNGTYPLKTYQTYAFRNAKIPSVSATDVQATAATSWTLPSITTVDNDSFVFFAIGNDRDANSTANVSGYTNSNLANITEIHDQTTSTGLGGGIATVYAEEATPSSIGTTSATSASSNTAAFITFAIAPAVITAEAGTYSYTGTDATLTYTPVGGFTLTADSGTYSYTGTAANLTNKYPESASDSTLGTVSGTAYVAISDILKVSTTSSASLTFSGELTFQPQTLTNGVYDVEIIWRYRTVGGSFVDVGSGIGSSSTAEVESGTLIIVGEISAATTQGSLSANTNYEVQLYARRTVSSPTNTIEFSGTAQVDATGDAYSLTADAGSYSYAGTAAALIAARKVIANSGSYTYSGTAANLYDNKLITADSGSFAYTGGATSLVTARKVTADAGSFSYAGTNANVLFNRVFAVDSGAYSYTGTDASLKRGFSLTADSGSYSYAGTAASALFGRKVTADSGSYTYAGTDATLTYTPVTNLSITADSGSFSYNGGDASLKVGYAVIADSGSYSYSGATANILISRTIATDAGTFAYSGNDAELLVGRTISADSGTFSYSGTAANILVNLKLTADTSSYSYSGTNASLLYNRKLALDSGSFSYSGGDATLTFATSIVKIRFGANLISNLKYGSFQVYEAYLGSTQVWGTARPANTIIAETTAFTYTGSDATMFRGRKFSANSGTYSYSGTAATLKMGRKLVADSGTYTITGGAATLSGLIPNGFTYTDDVVGTGTVQASLQLASNGTAFYSTGAAQSWYAPATTNIGASYWAELVAVSGTGTMSGSALSTRIQISGDPQWILTRSTLGVSSRTFTLNFYDASTGGSLLSSGTVTLTAESS